MEITESICIDLNETWLQYSGFNGSPPVSGFLIHVIKYGSGQDAAVRGWKAEKMWIWISTRCDGCSRFWSPVKPSPGSKSPLVFRSVISRLNASPAVITLLVNLHLIHLPALYGAGAANAHLHPPGSIKGRTGEGRGAASRFARSHRANREAEDLCPRFFVPQLPRPCPPST